MIGGCRRMPGVHTLFPQPQAVSSVLELQKGKVRCPLMVVSRCPIRLRNMLALGGSVSATRLWWAIRTKPLHTDPHRFLKPSPIVRVSAFRSNSSRFTDTLGKLFASRGVLSNLVSKGSNMDISYDSNPGTWSIHVLF